MLAIPFFLPLKGIQIMKELELTLKAFEKRTTKQKQQYILELTRENHKRIKDIKLMLKEIKELKNINKQYRDYVVKTKTYFKEQNNIEKYKERVLKL